MQLSEDIKAAIYDDGFRPALLDVAPEDLQNWPPTYKDSLFRARNKSGTLQFGTRSMSRWNVEEFSTRLKEELLLKHAWARDMTYMIQIKGVKEGNRHNPNQADSQTALELFLADIDTNDGTWFVDVGLEISENAKVYQWRTDSHASVLQEVLGINRRQADSATNPSNWRYSRDMSSHILDLSGCRVDLTSGQKGPHMVEYTQLYTTDKAVVYHLERGRHSKVMTGHEAIRGKPPKFTEELYAVFFNSRNEVDCAARAELRVPLAQAASALLGISNAALSRSLVVYPRKIWWSVVTSVCSLNNANNFHRLWKALRVESISYTLALQNQSPAKSRHAIDAMDLTIGLTWLLSGISSRPDDGLVGREVMLRILPITENYAVGNLLFQPPSRRDQDLPVPFCPYGAVFLSDLKWPPETSSPRLALRNRVALSDLCYQAYFKCDYKELHYKLVQSGIEARSNGRVPMRKGNTRPHRNRNPEPLPDFGRLTIAFPETGADMGDDLPVEEVVTRRPEESPDLTATRLWLRFLTDVLQKCGNEKRGESYCCLAMADRERVNIDTYRDLDLSKVFRKVQWKRPSNRELLRTFTIFWPNKDHILPQSAQNFRMMGYYLEWKAHCSEMRESDVVKLKRSLFEQFSSLNWIPAASADRVWSYGIDDSYQRLPLGIPSSARAPRIFVLNGTIPVWGNGDPGDVEVDQDLPIRQGLLGERMTRRVDEYMHLREEEEESSEEEVP